MRNIDGRYALHSASSTQWGIAMTFAVIEGPALEPVTLDELKLALRIDSDDLDADLAMLIQSAREQAEHETGLFLMPQVVRLDLTDWPTDLLIKRAPVSAITSIQYWDGSAWQTVDDASYVFYPEGTMWRIDPDSGWPSLGNGRGPRVRVLFAAGFASAAAVPAVAKRFIIAQVGAWLSNPEATTADRMELSPLFSRMLDPIRIYA